MTNTYSVVSKAAVMLLLVAGMPAASGSDEHQEYLDGCTDKEKNLCHLAYEYDAEGREACDSQARRRCIEGTDVTFCETNVRDHCYIEKTNWPKSMADGKKCRLRAAVRCALEETRAKIDEAMKEMDPRGRDLRVHDDEHISVECAIEAHSSCVHMTADKKSDCKKKHQKLCVKRYVLQDRRKMMHRMILTADARQKREEAWKKKGVKQLKQDPAEVIATVLSDDPKKAALRDDYDIDIYDDEM